MTDYLGYLLRMTTAGKCTLDSLSITVSTKTMGGKSFFFRLPPTCMELRDFQTLMRELYFHRDSQRGVEKTFMWITEELGELGRALRKRDESAIKEEMADVLAWLFSLGNLLDIDVEKAVLSKYDKVCPRCRKTPCECPFP